MKLQEVKENLEVKEIKFTNDKTQIAVNAEFFMDIKTKLKDLDVLLKFQEQDYKQKLSQQRKEILFEISKLLEDKVPIKVFEDRLTYELNILKEKTIKEIIQLLYDKGVFDDAKNKDQVWEPYLNFSDKYLIEKIWKRK